MEKSKPIVLIVDDETIITRVLTRALEKEDMDILVAHDGKRGLELIHERKPDIILMDIIMPELSGVEVLEKMRASNIHIPVILMTAYGDAQTEQRAKNLAVSAYITKPFKDIRDVVSLVKDKM